MHFPYVYFCLLSKLRNRFVGFLILTSGKEKKSRMFWEQISCNFTEIVSTEFSYATNGYISIIKFYHIFLWSYVSDHMFSVYCSVLYFIITIYILAMSFLHILKYFIILSMENFDHFMHLIIYNVDPIFYFYVFIYLSFMWNFGLF